MVNLNLSEIVEAICANSYDSKKVGIVSGISTDTRTINKGDLYFAFIGDNYDGHNFVKIAEEKGAVAVVCSKKVSCNIPVLYVNDTLKAFQDLALYYRNKLNIKIIAVTGSYGKTTTKNMIATVLRSKYKIFSSDRNYNNEIGVPKSIFELNNNYDIAVLELGMSHQGEIHRLSNIIKPDIAIITNIGKAHIGNLGSIDNILKAKLEILDGLKNEGILLINGDDEMLSSFKNENYNTVFFSKKGFEQVTISIIESDDNKTCICFDLYSQNVVTKFEVPLFGKHHIINILMAIYCGIKFGVKMPDIQIALRNYMGSPMRAEISMLKGISIIKDYYNSTPETAKSSIEALSNYKVSGKKIVILGEMDELGNYSYDEHVNLARLCRNKLIDITIFIGKDFENFNAGSENTAICFAEKERQKLKLLLKDYVNQGKINEGDVILIKGSRSMKLEEFYETLKEGIETKGTKLLPLSMTKLAVDIEALKHNFREIKQRVGRDVEIMPVVKANAYGLGDEIISSVYNQCKYLAVGDIREAEHVHCVLPHMNILIIYQPIKEYAEFIIHNGYTISVSDIKFAEFLNDIARENGKQVKIHIEIDTGMGRQGILPNQCKEFAEKIKTLKYLNVEGIWMHYSSADSLNPRDLDFTEYQTKQFKKAIERVEAVLGTIQYKHACASAAIFNPKAEHFNMVRPGIALYGYYPYEYMKKEINLKPALKLFSVITQIKEIKKGVPIGYGRKFYTTRDKNLLATVPIGYQHGLSRLLSNKGSFVVNGQLAPIRGSVCMDYTIIDITDIKGEVNVGDQVAIFDNINMTVEKIAELSESFNYEVIAKLHDNAKRLEFF